MARAGPVLPKRACRRRGTRSCRARRAGRLEAGRRADSFPGVLCRTGPVRSDLGRAEQSNLFSDVNAACELVCARRSAAVAAWQADAAGPTASAGPLRRPLPRPLTRFQHCRRTTRWPSPTPPPPPLGYDGRPVPAIASAAWLEGGLTRPVTRQAVRPA